LFQSRRSAGPDPIPACNYDELGEQARPDEAEDLRPPDQDKAVETRSAVSTAKPAKSKMVGFVEPPPDDPFRYGASKSHQLGYQLRRGRLLQILL